MRSKALLLDRDGVINVDKSYVYKVEDFEFSKDIFEALLRFQQAGFLLVIVTNQAGIGRGYYTEEDFRTLTTWMTEQFEAHGILITKVYFCPYHPVHGVGEYKQDAFCRKPNPGMILQAKREFQLDLASSVIIGDKESDIEAGLRVGVGTTILIRNGEASTATAATFTVKHVGEAAERFFETCK
ncbi:D-glycero-beta-D-manno-heptose 1,7-bisphosphate 7-phosphatase [Paenibacillus qinlingensis]|uniref:D-glycero-beta-D-manno-heptose 1,7-bisphosphate 7-phosphatase n=1 Tax=Paenibacillus qinlingensis TaxID=1837343 RepID=UPI0015633DC4|nr:D-glycero-beta-D-manno-heptose 1,7-bisphosphate 7-phosphatase [Paenibacillus qinlingensis]NQX61403.1 D-glycero-beta-D-manno-heptose 1,7-bisphosphate 7-phosphatase [Paenibacillus qinlingensis]